ncbi:MAG: hypothetical protein AAFR21_14610 [Pseudomonadota bacterium]
MIIDLAETRKSGAATPLNCTQVGFEALPVPGEYPSKAFFAGLFTTSRVAAELLRMDKATAATRLASAADCLGDFIEDLDFTLDQVEALAAVLSAARARATIIATEGASA